MIHRNYIELRQVKGSLELAIPMLYGKPIDSMRLDPALYRIWEDLDVKHGVFRLRANFVGCLRVNQHGASGKEYNVWKRTIGKSYEAFIESGAFLVKAGWKWLDVQYNEKSLLYLNVAGWTESPIIPRKGEGVIKFDTLEEGTIYHVK